MMSRHAYARHRRDKGLPGVTFQAVQTAITQGRITLIDGKIDADKADRAWAGNTTPTNDFSETFSEARARKEAAQADIAEMEAAKLRGETISGQDVEASWAATVVSFRARLMVLAPTAAPLVVGKTLAEAQAVIQRLVFEALTELSGNGLPDRGH